MEPYIYDEKYKQTFDALINKEGDCWRWKIYTPNSQATGRYYHRSQYRGNRLVAYEIYNNISFGITTPRIFSKCKNKACINPSHMSLNRSLKD